MASSEETAGQRGGRKNHRELIRFLVFGTLAALINWLARFPLSLFLPFEIAVLGAYAIGMLSGFLLYRRYVFPASSRSLRSQVANFLLVNAIGAVVVVVLAKMLSHHLLPLIFADRDLCEALGHGIAIGTSAATSFVGHKFLTFAAPRKAGD